ncbi:type II toxin-antitoxin system VapC family toxin [Candidatus Roizmanbacteria bacterium]|nr:type II toxin-antitoxin system VapC family toxin [Candidatus Roizmanbacteria bacterium]
MLRKALTPGKVHPTRDNVYIDTSFFIATQTANHPRHSRAVAILESCKKWRLFFSLLTIDEIMYTLLQFNLSRNRINTIIRDKILSIHNVHLITYPPDLKSIEKYLTIWGMTGLAPRDALHLYLMRTKKIQYLATFDLDFKRNQHKLGISVL